MDEVYVNRLIRLREAMRESDIDGMIILDRDNTFYLTGFCGSASILVIMSDVAVFLADGRFFEQVRKSLSLDMYEIIFQNKDGKEQIKGFFGIRGKLRIGFESSIPYERYLWLSEAVRPARLVDACKILTSARMLKDEKELRLIRRAAAITDRCVEMILKELKPGVTEHELAVKIRRFFEDGGAEGESFPTIVAFGINSAYPHHETSRRRLKAGEAALFDLGCRVKGYCSDLTRTVFVGSSDARQRKVYEIVLGAQGEAIKKIKPGVSAREVDAAAREYISNAGFGDAFRHNTGHGVGINVHEQPRLTPLSDDILKKGMVITVEPGIYLPNFMGVRIEDLVLVGEDGPVALSKSPKKMRIISQ
ncbi:MAG: Xaa-Pro peptidase family protein [Candidatus Sumerlaeota bacterium]|nr:Xaa-Pro peptidase family protein [Candidatus Sumerlaeota bacterium]